MGQGKRTEDERSVDITPKTLMRGVEERVELFLM